MQLERIRRGEQEEGRLSIRERLMKGRGGEREREEGVDIKAETVFRSSLGEYRRTNFLISTSCVPIRRLISH